MLATSRDMGPPLHEGQSFAPG